MIGDEGIEEREHRPAELVGREVAEPSQELGHLLGGARGLADLSQAALDAADRGRVEPERGGQQRVEEVVCLTRENGDAARSAPLLGSSH